jgi:hypothetical protein
LLLNGQPIQIRGAARHEDFPINGRGLNLAVAVRDIQLLKWIGGNSFRTSHYPYAEETMQLADREGMLVIDEIPAVKLYFGDSDENVRARLDQCRQDITELARRDKNHPSVIMWSLANEPVSNRFVNAGGADLPLDDAYKATRLLRGSVRLRPRSGPHPAVDPDGHVIDRSILGRAFGRAVPQPIQRLVLPSRRPRRRRGIARS